MKEIYSFEIKRKVNKQVEEQTKEGKLVKEVEEEIPVKIIFKRPSRAESEEADIVSSVEYSESIRKGILTKPLLERFYDEKGGFLAENYEAKYGQLLSKFFGFENEYRRLTLKDNKTSDDNERLNQLAADFVKVQQDLQALEASRNNLFQNTAETRAQNKTIFWLTLFLTYTQENEKEPMPFFVGTTFEDKRADYDKKIESEDPFIFKVIDKMSFLTALWFLGRASTKEDFQRIEDNLNPPSPKEETKEEKMEVEEKGLDKPETEKKLKKAQKVAETTPKTS